MKKRHWRVSERIAYHEAGHAVVAHHYSRTISEITIVPDLDREVQGETVISHRKRTAHEILLQALGVATIHNAEEDLTILMSGIEAVKLVRKVVNDEKWMEAKDDILKAHSIATDSGCRDKHNRYFAVAAASTRAESILKARRKALTALANALRASETLSGQDAAQIIVSNLE